MAKRVYFIDFDGTCTGSEGQKTIESKFFESFIKPTQYQYHYQAIPMKDSKTIQTLLKKKFGEYPDHFNPKHSDAQFLMSLDAVNFFREGIKNEEVDIIIVTSNRKDYIQEQFKFFKFTEDEINKITIEDKTRRDKVVVDYLDQHQEIEHVYIMDDHAQACDAMLSQACKYDKIIHCYNCEPNHFQWNQYLKEMTSTTNEIFTPNVLPKVDKKVSKPSAPNMSTFFPSNNNQTSTHTNASEFWVNLAMSLAILGTGALLFNGLLNLHNGEDFFKFGQATSKTVMNEFAL